MRLFCNGHLGVLFGETKIMLFDKRDKNVRTINLNKQEIACHQDNHQISEERFSHIVACDLSDNLKYLAVATSNKRLFIWETEDLSLVANYDTFRFPNSIAFARDCLSVLVADKTGDVYSFNVLESSNNDTEEMETLINDDPDIEAGPEPVMGHLSMLLDIITTRCGKYVITCDRDEKIRVSRYPNMYNIHGFCLGHEEFVSQILEVPTSNQNLLLSCSGDGTLRLWNYLTGKCLSCVEPKSVLSQDTHDDNYLPVSLPEDMSDKIAYAVTRISILSIKSTTYIAAVMYRVNGIVVHKIEGENLVFSYLYKLPSPVLELTTFGDTIIVWLEGLNVIALELSDNGITEIHKHPLQVLLQENIGEFSDPGLHDIQVLYKQRVDNVSTYLAKKEARISTKITNDEDQPLKKLKVS